MTLGIIMSDCPSVNRPPSLEICCRVNSLPFSKVNLKSLVVVTAVVVVVVLIVFGLWLDSGFGGGRFVVVVVCLF